MDKTQMTQIVKSISQEFGLSAPANAMFRWGGGSNLKKKGGSPHVWDPLLVKKLFIWASGKVGQNLYVSGPTGCGKTAGLLEFIRITGNLGFLIGISHNFEVNEALGIVELVPIKQDEDDQPKGTGWVDRLITSIGRLARSTVATKFVLGELGEALVATRTGKKVFIIFDEITQKPDMALAPFLDGRPIRLPSGEIIDSSEIFFAGTGNTVGGVDEFGRHGRLQKWDDAFSSRFAFHLKVDYLEAELEEKILEGECPKISQLQRKQMVEFANGVRGLYKTGSIGKPLATRTLVWWGKLSLEMAAMPLPGVSAMKAALIDCYANQCTEEDHQTVLGIWQSLTGE